MNRPHLPPRPIYTHGPVPPPGPPASAHTDQPGDSTRSRWAHMERTAAAIDAARVEGHAEGVRSGYVQGWRWGLACGIVLGALVAGLCWGAWLFINVPTAVPTAAVGML